MDELDLLRAASPDPGSPTDETVRRHRVQLAERISVAEAGDPPTEGESQRTDGSGVRPPGERTPPRPEPVSLTEHRPPRYFRAAVAAAIVVGVITGGGLLAARWVAQDDETRARESVSAANPPGSTSTEVVSEPLCGVALPRQLVVPTGFVGPRSVAAVDAPNAATSDQLALSWTSGALSIEARWPADAEVAEGLPITDPPVPAPSPGFGASSPLAPELLESGRFFSYIAFQLPDQEPRCQTLQVSVIGEDAAAVMATLDAIRQHPFESASPPLVVDSQPVETTPRAAPCPTPPGVDSPNRGGAIADSPVAPTPTAALEAFVRADTTLPQSGYHELQLPDGSVAYGSQSPGMSWVTVIHVLRAEGGWTVDAWEASGC